MDHAADMMWDAIDAFTETVPTTVPGLLAMLIYAEEIANRRDCDAFNDTEIFSILATAMALYRILRDPHNDTESYVGSKRRRVYLKSFGLPRVVLLCWSAQR